MRLLLALDFVDATERILAAVVPLAKGTGGCCSPRRCRCCWSR
jgi:hypothetical protein